MILFIEHDLLVSGPDLESCSQHVLSFFDKSQLVHYDSVEVDPDHSASGTDNHFDELLNKAIKANKKILGELLAKLEDDGCTTFDDLLNLPQGFQSKMLHTISHLLDGFFGIDSRFFDIDELSHWVTESRKNMIDSTPDQCWIIRVKAKSVYGQGFETKSR